MFGIHYRQFTVKKKIQRNIKGAVVNLLPLPPKLQTVAEKFSNVFDSPIIEFYHMNPCGFLFLYLIFSFHLISRNVD